MDSNFLKLYIEQNKNLAKTIVIKSQYSPDLINDQLKLKYGPSIVDTNQPKTWKYYLNLSGEYHNTDTLMYVTSLDTLEEILFNKENLELHSATKRAYEFGSRYYYALLNRYPDQESLIIGILYPVDIDKAVSSPNGTILGYPINLVEDQELTLIEDLQTYIINYLVRWDVISFAVSDDLYPAAQHAIMYLNVLTRLLNLRLKRCKTNEAHSFHIREYLASHGRLDKYVDYMTLKQQLFLYRNLLYLENNSGKTDIFLLLVEKLLSERYIPLSEITIRALSQFDNDLYPEINVRKKAINSFINIPEKDFFSLNNLYDKEKKTVYGNVKYFQDNEPFITHQLKTTNTSVLMTKDLESFMIDHNDSVPDPLLEVLLSHWVNLTTNNLFNSVVHFRDPKTLEDKTLLAKDAFIYYYYIFLRSIGLEFTRLPKFVNIKELKINKPSITKMLSVTDKRFKFKPLAENVKSNMPLLTNIYSIDNFFNQSFKIYSESLRHWRIASNMNDHYEKASFDNMIYVLYQDRVIDFNIPNINDWLASKNLTEYNYSTNQANELILSLFKASTGLKIDSNKLLPNIQKAMLAILKQLSSYSVQFMHEINLSAIKPLNWSAIRLGDLKLALNHLQKSLVNVRVLEVKAVSTNIENFEVIEDKDFTKISSSTDYNYEIKSINSVVSNIKTYDTFIINYPKSYIEAEYNGKLSEVSDYSAFIGYENYLNLSNAQKTQLKSIY